MDATMAEFLERLITMVNDLTVVPFAVPLIVLVVSVLKRFIPAEWVGSGKLHFIVQAVFWLGYAVFARLGGDLPAFEEWTMNITKILEVVVPLLLPFAVSMFGAHATYKAALSRGVTGLGYKRPVGAATLPDWLLRVRRATAPKKEPVG